MNKIGQMPVFGSSNDSSSSGTDSDALLTRTDPAGLPARLLQIFDQWCQDFFPHARDVDIKRNDGLVVDEMIPPTLLVLEKCAKGSEDMRIWLKDRLLPVDL